MATHAGEKFQPLPADHLIHHQYGRPLQLAAAQPRQGIIRFFERKGNDGLSLMWMPPQTTMPPLATALSACGTNSPTGAEIMAASSSSGGDVAASPAQTAPSDLANRCAAVSPGRVKAKIENGVKP